LVAKSSTRRAQRFPEIVGAELSAKGLPQLAQKVLSAATVAPQLLHLSSDPGKRSPHVPQNRAPDLFFPLHLGHSTWNMETMVYPPEAITGEESMWSSR
jgi:hypothetical protein